MHIGSNTSDDVILKAIGYCGLGVAVIGVLIGVLANTVV